jgi:hypothetical protein
MTQKYFFAALFVIDPDRSRHLEPAKYAPAAAVLFATLWNEAARRLELITESAIFIAVSKCCPI